MASTGPVQIVENKKMKMADLAAHESHSKKKKKKKTNQNDKKNIEKIEKIHTPKQSLATHRHSHFQIRNAKLFHIVEALSGSHSNGQ